MINRKKDATQLICDSVESAACIEYPHSPFGIVFDLCSAGVPLVESMVASTSFASFTAATDVLPVGGTTGHGNPSRVTQVGRDQARAAASCSVRPNSGYRVDCAVLVLRPTRPCWTGCCYDFLHDLPTRDDRVSATPREWTATLGRSSNITTRSLRFWLDGLTRCNSFGTLRTIRPHQIPGLSVTCRRHANADLPYSRGIRAAVAFVLDAMGDRLV